MKYVINVIIGLLTVLSSYCGAKIATEQELQRPERQARIAEARATELKAKAVEDSLVRVKAIADSIQAATNTQPEISREERLRLNQLCYMDWDLAHTVDEKRDVIAGQGVFMLKEHGSCTADSWGRITWTDVER